MAVWYKSMLWLVMMLLTEKYDQCFDLPRRKQEMHIFLYIIVLVAVQLYQSL
jgi:hypothetical protein